MINPSKTGEALNSPIERASTLNDPKFENQQGYFAYDLTHQEFVTPLFGKITPTMHLDTVPADRVVVHDNAKTILNQIQGNFLNNINQYQDSFFVSLRSVFPNNYEKLIPNPVKGDDLPTTALPLVPFAQFIMDYLRGEYNVTLNEVDYDNSVIYRDVVSVGSWQNIEEPINVSYLLGRLALLATVLSRGELMDYLGIQFDNDELRSRLSSELQEKIDAFFDALYLARNKYLDTDINDVSYIYGVELSLTSNSVDYSDTANRYLCNNKEEWRQAISDAFEAGQLISFVANWRDDSEEVMDLAVAVKDLCGLLNQIFGKWFLDEGLKNRYMIEVDTGNYDIRDGSHINIGKLLAYQQIVAHYFTNDKIDNIFSSELFMQLLRGTMYPTADGSFSREPVFDYNGVATEYDYISAGGFFQSLISDEIAGHSNRQYVFMTLMMLLRRSLRYGDYFSTARIDMLAVSDQLNIATTGSLVSPIDITKGLLMQRYLNAANYIGQGFLSYMASEYGVKPSDSGCIPRFISHRKVQLQNQITNNTANNQGAQTTNIVGYTDDAAYDVFIDDFGYLLTLMSYDVLPIYKSGIEASYYLADRFDYFNPMLQGIGDQPIRSSELIGNPSLFNDSFGYTMRNGEYKYKLSKCHGAFVNGLNGFMLSYPLAAYRTSLSQDSLDLNIDPNFIRDKAIYIDPLVHKMDGTSPGNYYHFVVSCTNQVQAARKIQATPGVLF